ncbi:hypothetical protein WG66_005958 [Moniliophthora roreri]|nr:hypothetical protein WG66_005958 [Moniliophthora roreri]
MFIISDTASEAHDADEDEDVPVNTRSLVSARDLGVFSSSAARPSKRPKP